MNRALAAMLVLGLGVASPAWAKGAKKKAEAVKAPKKPEFKPVGGPLPALPRPTELSLHFSGDATDSESFAAAVSATSEITTATGQHMAWNIAQWRVQLGADVKKLKGYRRLLANELRASQRANFPVAIRYLTGSYDSANQLTTLAEQSLAQFNSLYTSDRDAEIQRDPPEAARRVRLYLDRTQALYSDAKKFVARTTQSHEEKIIRVGDAED